MGKLKKYLKRHEKNIKYAGVFILGAAVGGCIISVLHAGYKIYNGSVYIDSYQANDGVYYFIRAIGKHGGYVHLSEDHMREINQKISEALINGGFNEYEGIYHFK